MQKLKSLIVPVLLVVLSLAFSGNLNAKNLDSLRVRQAKLTAAQIESIRSTPNLAKAVRFLRKNRIAAADGFTLYKTAVRKGWLIMQIRGPKKIGFAQKEFFPGGGVPGATYIGTCSCETQGSDTCEFLGDNVNTGTCTGSSEGCSCRFSVTEILPGGQQILYEEPGS